MNPQQLSSSSFDLHETFCQIPWSLVKYQLSCTPIVPPSPIGSREISLALANSDRLSWSIVNCYWPSCTLPLTSEHSRQLESKSCKGGFKNFGKGEGGGQCRCPKDDFCGVFLLIKCFQNFRRKGRGELYDPLPLNLPHCLVNSYQFLSTLVHSRKPLWALSDSCELQNWLTFSLRL